MADEAPLIDPALLANLTEAERAEALAAAAAAQRAEKRAEERRRLREQAAAADASSKNNEEDEEERLLREAEEQRRRQREHERAMERQNAAVASSAAIGIIGGSSASGGGGSGLTFVSKKKRGAGQMSNQLSSGAATSSSRDTSLSLPPARGNGVTTTNADNTSNAESHLTATQLAQIKKAYLGNSAPVEPSASAVVASNYSGRSSNQSELSARQKLSQERKKRRTKKTTFKFEWDAGEDTYDDDDPLYASTMSSFAKNGKFSSQRNNNTNRRGSSTNQQDLDGGIRFGKKSSSNYDAVATVQTVATKPLKKMTARDWRIFRENYNISTKGGKSPPPLRSFRENPIGVTPIHPSIIDAIENNLRYKEPSPIQRIAIPIGMQRRYEHPIDTTDMEFYFSTIATLSIIICF